MAKDLFEVAGKQGSQDKNIQEYGEEEFVFSETVQGKDNEDDLGEDREQFAPEGKKEITFDNDDEFPEDENQLEMNDEFDYGNQEEVIQADASEDSGEDPSDSASENQAVDPITIEDFNKTMNTNYKSMEEAKADLETPVAPVVTEQEKQEYGKRTSAISYLENLKTKDDRTIVREHMIAESGLKNPTEEELEEIDSKIESMVDNDTLFLRADRYKDKLDKRVDNLSAANKQIDKKISDNKNQEVRAQRVQLDAHFNKMNSQGSIYGVHIDKQDILEARKDATSGRFFKELENNPDLVAELSLLRQMKNKFVNNGSKKTFEQGIEHVMGKGNESSRSSSNREKARGANANSQRSHRTRSSSGDELTDALLS